MNILFVSSARGWGGGEVWLREICEGLAKRGHRTAIACRQESEIMKRLGGGAVRLLPVRLAGELDPSAVLALRGVMRAERTGLVCCNMEKEFRIGGMAARLAGVPIVMSREVDRPIKNTLVNRYFYGRIGSGIMVNSHATRETLITSAPWLASQRIEVVWKGIDTDTPAHARAAAVREQFHLRSDDVVAGFVGRLDEQKGIIALLEAMKIAAAKNARIKLVIAGDGNQYDTIVEFVKANGLAERIFLAGFRDDVPAFMKAIDFLVMPSLWEGFGYSAVEAMAASKAVIATNVSSLPEIVRDGETGILVPPGSPDPLANAMLVLASRPDLAAAYGAAGAIRARTLFNLTTMVERTEKFFLETVQSRRQR
jgi:glycosyltransferase involved in cell wall biosynthesis